MNSLAFGSCTPSDIEDIGIDPIIFNQGDSREPLFGTEVQIVFSALNDYAVIVELYIDYRDPSVISPGEYRPIRWAGETWHGPRMSADASRMTYFVADISIDDDIIEENSETNNKELMFDMDLDTSWVSGLINED